MPQVAGNRPRVCEVTALRSQLINPKAEHTAGRARTVSKKSRTSWPSDEMRAITSPACASPSASQVFCFGPSPRGVVLAFMLPPFAPFVAFVPRV